MSYSYGSPGKPARIALLVERQMRSSITSKTLKERVLRLAVGIEKCKDWMTSTSIIVWVGRLAFDKPFPSSSYGGKIAKYDV